MSKKRFSEGIDELFNDPHMADEAMTATAVGGTGTARAVVERRAHSKNFVSDLDALLQEAMDESFERYEARQQPGASGVSGKTKSALAAQPQSVQGFRAPLSGLDALIRQTIEVREITAEDIIKKRLTVAVDKPKLDKLKTIARMENSFLKDILVNLIDDYIKEYTSHKGIDL